MSYIPGHFQECHETKEKTLLKSQCGYVISCHSAGPWFPVTFSNMFATGIYLDLDI